MCELKTGSAAMPSLSVSSRTTSSSIDVAGVVAANISNQESTNEVSSSSTSTVHGGRIPGLESMSPQQNARTHHSLLPHDPMEFICGWGAASINVTLTFPLNKLIFRQQLHGVSTRVAWAQLQREGLMHLYRGLLPPFLQKTTSMALMFGMYDYYRHLLLRRVAPGLPEAVNKSAAAILAGCTEAILSPFERVQTLMQDKNHHNKWRNTVHAMQDIRSRYGVAEFYRGLTTILLRNGPSNAMFFLGREKLRNQLPKATTHSGEIACNFVSGACMGAFISTLYFPMNVVKTKMQSNVGGRFKGINETFWVVFYERNRSIKRMFLGAQWNFTRSLISWGIINASYELLKKLMYT